MKNINGLSALVEGFRDGGVEIITNFPGYYSHKLFSKLGGEMTSINEKIAYEIAWGASLAGKRSLTTFKNVGLSDAADPFLNSHLVGVNGGLVVVVFDDIDVEGSQSRQDSRNYFDFFGSLWLEPYSTESAYELAYKSFQWSEKFSLPVVIRITSQLIYSKGSFKRKQKSKGRKTFKRDNKQFVVHPINSSYQRRILTGKNKKIEKFVENLYKKPILKTTTLVAGCNIREEKKFKLENIFRIFTYPLPINIIKQFLNGPIKVFEQGTPFVREKIDALKGNTESFTGIIPDNSNGYIISKNYEKLFRALSKIESRIVLGDLGEYTKDTLESINACLCFGSSISVGLGASIASPKKKIFSIIGDAAYLHSGKNIIPELLKRKSSANIIIIDNDGSQGTGGQKIPGDLYYQPKEVEIYKKKYENTSYAEFKALLGKMSKSKKVSVLYLQMEIKK